MPTNALITASLLSLIPPSWNSNVRVDFRVVDDSGTPVSNAVIRIHTRRDRIALMEHRLSPLREIVSVSDFRRAKNGVVVEHLLEPHRDVPIVLRRRINPIPMFRHRIRIPASSGRLVLDLKKGGLDCPARVWRNRRFLASL